MHYLKDAFYARLLKTKRDTLDSTELTLFLQDTCGFNKDRSALLINRILTAKYAERGVKQLECSKSGAAFKYKDI